MKVTNPDKVMYPGDGYTKADVVGYYESVASAMVPHIAGRPLTLERYPNGIGAKGFMQKNASAHFPGFIERAEMPKRDGVTVHAVVSNVDGIAYLANQGTISFHATTTRAGSTRPDRMIFDLDPPAGDLASAREATAAVGAFLDEIDLTGFPMASGSKGYHVVVPIAAEIEIDVVDRMARQAAELLARRHPGLLTTRFKIDEREGKVFVDWLRNRSGATSIAPWSLRPRPGGPVAVPITWDELAGTRPDGWTIESAPARLGALPGWGRVDPAPDLGPAAATVAGAVAEAGITIEPFDRFRS